MSNDSYQREPGRELYRDPDNGKICGVCAGVANYFGFETWVVRVIAVSLLIFLNGGMILGYFIACWLLEVKPGSKTTNRCGPFGHHFSGRNRRNNTTANNSTYRPNVQDVWRKGNSASNTLDRVNKKFSNLEQRLRGMESYVTSDKFKLDKEFESINK